MRRTIILAALAFFLFALMGTALAGVEVCECRADKELAEMAGQTSAPTETPEPTDTPVPTDTPTPVPAPTPTVVPGLVARELPIDRSGGRVPAADKFTGDTLYEDSSIRMEMERVVAYESNCFVVKVSIGHPSQLRTETASQTWKYRRTAPGHKLAARVNAVVAIDGDFYSYINGGYMIRQGEMYRNQPDPRRDVLLIDDKGDFHIVEYSDKDNLAPYADKNIINSFNFGPGLIVDGRLGTNMKDYNNGAERLRQRTAIGQAGELTYYLFVTEARSDGSRGMTLAEFQEFVSRYPVINCYNLDGGNSSHLIINNTRVNAVGFRDVREINDIVYFATTEGEENGLGS